MTGARSEAERAGTGPVAAMPAPLVLDLLAALLDGGAAPRTALRSVAGALREVGDPRAGGLLTLADSAPLGTGSAGAWSGIGAPGVRPGGGAAGARPGAGAPVVARGPGGGGPGGGGEITDLVAEALWLAVRAGLPPAALIRRAAEEERRRAATAHLKAIRRLEVMLVLPAGLCLLPAFVLLSIVPVLLDLVLG